MVTPAGYLIREPNTLDADEIARVHVRGWREAYSHLLPEEFYGAAAIAQRTGMWRSILKGPTLPAGLRVMVAEAGTRLVGFAFAGDAVGEDAVRPLRLHALYITSDWYGTGVGQALLDSVLGADPAELWVAEDNPRARAFYRRNGFAPDGAMKIDQDANDLVELRLVR